MRSVLAVLMLAACGGGDAQRLAPDAPTNDDPADAPPMYPACDEFSAQGVLVPAHVEGTLTGADVASPAACAATDAPYGAESAGPDRVVPVQGLRAGSTYVVKLVSASDLQFYVATGCSTPTGPGDAQCVLFEDASLDSTEVGRFVATGASAFVVVDFYASHAPPSAEFTLDVYEEECASTAQCSAATPACSDGLCVECVASFDCASAAAPRCDVGAHTCTAGDTCGYGDDAADPADDGPSGARVLVLDGSGRASAAGSICSTAGGEADFVAFDVTTVGETWDFQLAWSGSRDLDLVLFDASGTRLGMSFWEHPEHARLTYLPRGRYYARVVEAASSPDPMVVSYTLLAQRTLGAGCSTAGDCAHEFANQLHRGRCDAGACVAITGAGALGEGAACDSQSDCAAGLHCPSFFFVADADERSLCHAGCDDDTECAAGFVCTTYLASNFCVAKCTTDEQCPTAPASEPIAGPWFRLACDVPTGRCQL